MKTFTSIEERDLEKFEKWHDREYPEPLCDLNALPWQSYEHAFWSRKKKARQVAWLESRKELREELGEELGKRIKLLEDKLEVEDL